MLRHFTLFVILPLLLSACAGSPSYDRYGADGTLTPKSVAARPQMAAGKQVLWGGVIMKTVNLKDSTQIEVLAFPLDSSERPKIDEPALGRFVVDGCDICGVHVARAGELDLTNGIVSGCALGACVQVEGFDVTRLQEDVRYRDNDVNLDATDLPVPEPEPGF